MVRKTIQEIGEGIAILIGMRTTTMGSCSGGDRYGSILNTIWEVGVYCQGTGWGVWVENY